MKKIYKLILILLFSFILTACDNEPPQVTFVQDAIIVGTDFAVEDLVLSIVDNKTELNNFVISSNFLEVVNLEESGIYTITVSVFDERENVTTGSVEIEYYQSYYHYLLVFFKDEGEKEYNDNNELFYSITFSQGDRDFTFNMFESGTFSLSLSVDNFSRDTYTNLKIIFDESSTYYVSHIDWDDYEIDFDDNVLVDWDGYVCNIKFSDTFGLEADAENSVELILREFDELLIDNIDMSAEDYIEWFSKNIDSMEL